MTKICAGLNVVEIGSGSAAAAITGMVLADAGARVIKVEPPQGDALRARHPNGALIWNRGKESIVADLRTTAGRAELTAMAAVADVVIDGFSPGTCARWGIGADELTAVNQRLVHLSITAFGPTGPYRDIRGYDSLVAAKTGLWARGSFGHRDGAIMYPVYWASFGAAMQSVAGLMGALVVRQQTGRGQRLGATLYHGLDPLDYFVATIVQNMVKSGGSASSDARSATGASRYGVLVASKDGRFMQTSTMLPHQGRALAAAAGILDRLDDPKFDNLPSFANAEDAQEWEDMLIEAFRAEDLAHWLPRLQASPDVAFEIAWTSEEALDHPQIVHNGDVVTIDDPVHGPIREIGPIGHFSATPIGPERSAPSVGEHDGPLVASTPPTGEGGAAPAHPFSGTTVVEFGYFYAMPYGATMLASMGARVIKLEDLNGDPHRTSFGPEVASNKTTAAKESISVDLKTPEGRKIAHDLLATADVFLDGFRSGIAEKFGLGYDELRQINPRLLYVHAAGYGTDGPSAHRALYAQAAQAVGGSFGRQVGYWSDPANNVGMSPLELQVIVIPRLGQVTDGDSNAALGVLAAVSLGIYHQRRTGEGQFLRTSMISANAWCYSDDFCSYAGKPPVPLDDPEYYGTGALDRVYQAAGDEWVCVHVPGDAEFARFCEALDAPGLADDHRFADAAARQDHDDELISELTKAFPARSAAEWEERMTAARAGCVAVNMKGHPAVISYDSGLREAGLTVTYEHPLFGEMVRSAPPITFSETPGVVGPPCMRGQHNRKVLTELGYSSAQIDDLEARSIVRPPDAQP